MLIGHASQSQHLKSKSNQMTDSRPNIALFITDQMRGDCFGLAGHPVIQTPNIDWIGKTGFYFRHAYSACPVCIPARRTLMTGKKPSNQGVLMNYETRLEGPTLPGELSRAGYQTHLVGKLHLWPRRKLYGFMSADWSDGPGINPGIGDYGRFLQREGFHLADAGVSHGINQNGWVARPWHLEERLHFTNWCADKAVDFLERRDPTVPFFLKVSFHQPHQPCTPPQCYWDRYIQQDLPEPFVGDWARVFDSPQTGLPSASWRTALQSQQMKQYRAGYYGCINHIDDQIGRVLLQLPENTIVLFISDHGEMLGDHQWLRKRNAFEPSARIPFLIRFPECMRIRQEQEREEVVELMDIMPTLLQAADAGIPDGVEGKSLLPLLRGDSAEWRKYVHGECSSIPSLNSGMQYLTDGRQKYIWYPGSGQEQFFDLAADSREMKDLSGMPEHRETIKHWRSLLTDELSGRPEGFVSDSNLRVLSGPTLPYMPEYKNEP